MRRRGFTLIELLVVLATGSLVALALAVTVQQGYRSFYFLARHNAGKSDAAAAAQQIFRRVAKNHGYRLDDDNHGLSFADGCRICWRSDRLELSERARVRSLLSVPLLDFTALTQDGVLTVNLDLKLEDGSRLHEIYDYRGPGRP